jgi:WD40 repeat protein
MMFGVAAGRVVELHETATLQTHAHFQHGGDVISFEFDASGRRLVSGATDSVGYVWDVRSGALLADLTGASNWVAWPQFVGDSLVVATGNDGVLRFWDVDRRVQVLTLPGSRSPGRAVVHTGMNTYLLLAADGSFMSWTIPLSAW